MDQQGHQGGPNVAAPGAPPKEEVKRRVRCCKQSWAGEKLELLLGMERVMTWLGKLTRFEGFESSQQILHDSKINSTFFFTFCHWTKWNLVSMLIYEVIVTDKSKISLLSPVLALTRESRVRTPTRLEWLESLNSWLVPSLIVVVLFIRPSLLVYRSKRISSPDPLLRPRKLHPCPYHFHNLRTWKNPRTRWHTVIPVVPGWAFEFFFSRFEWLKMLLLAFSTRDIDEGRLH